MPDTTQEKAPGTGNSEGADTARTVPFFVKDASRSGLTASQARELGFRDTAHGYSIPYYEPLTREPMRTPDGKPFTRERLRNPVGGQKYKSPKNGGIRCYFPPGVHAYLATNPTAPLLLSEGEKKAAKGTFEGVPTVGLGGIWLWKSGKGDDSLNMDLVPYVKSGRDVVLIFDSDATATPRKAKSFSECAARLAAAVEPYGCRCYRVDLPELNGAKTGLDDWFVSGKTSNELKTYIETNRTDALWPEEPLPWASEKAPSPFPLAAMPEPFQRAARAAAAKAQAPEGMAAVVLLAGISAAAQSVANVVFAYPGHRLEWPLSEFFCCLALSGERKSTLDKIARRPLQEYETELVEKLAPQLARARADVAAWEAEKRGIEARIRDAAKGGDVRKTQAAREALQQHEAQQPAEPMEPALLIGADWTRERLLRDLHGWPCAAAIDSEGGAGLSGFSMTVENRRATLSNLCSLFDGRIPAKRRVGTRGTVAAGTGRFTMGFSMQPSAWHDIADQHADLASGVGFLPRLLICQPESTLGSCRYTPPPDGADEAIDEYTRRLLRVLRGSTMPERDEFGGALIEPPPLPISPEGAARLYQFMVDTERELGEFERLAQHTGEGRRAVEHAARVAGALELYATEGRARSVSLQSVDAGVAVANFFLSEALRLNNTATDPQQRDAAKLEGWLQREGGKAAKTRALQFGPIRKRSALDAAIEELAGMHRARLVKAGRTTEIHARPLANPAIPASREGPKPRKLARIAKLAEGTEEKTPPPDPDDMSWLEGE